MPSVDRCPDCQGTGKYIGLQAVEICQTCLGRGRSGSRPGSVVFKVKVDGPAFEKYGRSLDETLRQLAYFNQSVRDLLAGDL